MIKNSKLTMLAGAALAAGTALTLTTIPQQTSETVSAEQPTLLETAESGGAAKKDHVLAYTKQGKKKTLIRWEPCKNTITWKVNVYALPTKERAKAIADAKKAVSLISKATKIKYAYKGTTTFVPQQKTWHRKPPAELVISWVNTNKKQKHYSNILPPEKYLGYGGYIYKTYTYKKKTQSIIGRGYVVLDAKSYNSRVKQGWGKGVTTGNLLLHELAHTHGLGHTASKSSLMYSQLISRNKAALQSGDAEGLRKAGRAAGCADVPASIWKNI